MSIPRQAARKDFSIVHHLSMKQIKDYTSLDKDEKSDLSLRDKSQI